MAKRIVILGAGESGAGAAVLAKKQGFDTFVSDMSTIKDNIGQSLAYQVAECNYDYYVIELSSFQLDNMYKFHANIAVLMNITPDHLDRYDHQMQNYVDAKFRIIQNQTPDDAFIFWNDDPIIQRELHKYGIHVNSCWYALQSMKTKTILILGGKDKGNDYNEIADLVKEKCTGLIYMGLHNEKLHDFFDKFGLPVADVQSMKDAVDAAYRMAKKGETVLLSPCCASFDLFKSYEDRGEQFKECVRNL